MATVVDLVNVALGLLGDRANVTSIDPPEGSAQADHASRFWPIARDEALAAEDWTFASAYGSLSALTDTNARWTYAYSLPADFLVARELVYSGGAVVLFDYNSPQFEMASTDSGQRILFSHGELVTLRYTRRVTDPTRYPPGFVAAVQYLLASYLAGPVIKGKAGVNTMQVMRTVYERLKAMAAVTDANQSSVHQRHVPSAMAARGYGSRKDDIIESGQLRYSLPFWAQG